MNKITVERMMDEDGGNEYCLRVISHDGKSVMCFYAPYESAIDQFELLTLGNDCRVALDGMGDRTCAFVLVKNGVVQFTLTMETAESHMIADWVDCKDAFDQCLQWRKEFQQ